MDVPQDRLGGDSRCCGADVLLPVDFQEDAAAAVVRLCVVRRAARERPAELFRQLQADRPLGRPERVQDPVQLQGVDAGEDAVPDRSDQIPRQWVWLALEVGFAVVASAALNTVIRRTYPYLRTDLSAGKTLSRKYPDVITKIKQLFFHKIGGFALMQTSPIIIYAYASLTLVALYGNYMLIILGVSSLMGAVFNSMNAGVGNLVAEGNKERIMSVFEELFSVRFLLSCTVCFGVYMLTPAFITLWIGPEYVLDNLTLGLMVATLYISLARSTVDAYINAYGLFSDIWAPVGEASINIGMSVLLGWFFGLHGILAGVLLSLLIVVFCWKPYFLFRRGLKEKLQTYVSMYAKHGLLVSAVLAVMYLIHGLLPFDPTAGIGSWLIYGIVVIGIFFSLLFAALYIAIEGMPQVVKRLLSVNR